ncbi:MAG TPA: protein translocase subunit SecD [Caulobacteraceae bacterium]|jgi:preprotein translocase subunit SecD
MLRISRWKIVLVALATVLSLLWAAPNVLPASVRAGLPGWMSQTLNLGLDLQGGSYLLLEVDTAALTRERLNNLVEDVRTNLRAKQIAFADLGVVNGQVTVRVVDPARLEEAYRLLTTLTPVSPQTGRPDVAVTRQSDRLTMALSQAALQQQATDAVRQSIEIIRRRVDQLGTKEPSIAQQGTNRVVVQAPGEADPERLKRVIGQTAKLTFQMVDETTPAAEAAQGLVPPGSVLLNSDEQNEPQVLVKRRALVTGEMLQDSRADFDQQGRSVVTFRFNGEGARRFGEATAANVGRRFAIVLDEKVISAPVINEPITGGSGQISGNFNVETANDLALLLRSGALPAPLNFEEQRTVGAELGQDAVDAGILSTLLAFGLVLAFMVLAYGFLFGGIAIVGLVVNGIMIIAAMSLIQATLTLPGIAGLILTLAVAVDANVLIYERMREEARMGRAPIMAMEAGFSRAMITILDANLTTLVAALIMFFFGAGPVRGFAWTLTIGVFTSVFTAVMFSQVLLAWWFRAARPKKLPIV